MSATLDSLRANIVLDVDLRNGSFRDQSPTAAVGTPTGTLKWAQGRRGRHLQVGTGVSFLSVADAAAQRITSGTLLVFRNTEVPLGANARLISKRAAGGVNYELLMDGAGGLLYLYDGTSFSQSSVCSNNAAMYGMSLAGSGQKPRFYANGTFLSLGSLVVTLPTTAGLAAILGNTYTGASPATGLCRVVILNVVLDDATIAQIYSEMMRPRANLKPLSRNWRYPHRTVQAPMTRPLIEFDGGPAVAGKKLNLGSAGPTYDGTIVGAPPVVPGAFDDARDLNPATPSYWYTGNVTQLSGATKVTIELVAKFKSTNPGRDVFSWTDAGGNNRLLIYTASSRLYVQMDIGGAGRDAYVAFTPAATSYVHVRVEYDGTAAGADKIKVYIGGVAQVLTISAPWFAALPILAAPVYIGRRLAAGSAFVGELSYLRLWVGTVPSAAENAARYQAFARLLRFRQDMRVTPCTLANVSAGCIPGTEWERMTGTWAVTQDATAPYRRKIANVAGGVLTTPCKQAYGSWYGRMKASAANPGWILTESVKGAYTATGNAGYILYTDGTRKLVLLRFTAGAGVTSAPGTAGEIVDGTEYEYLITRTKAGVWNVWLRGGAFATWSLRIAAWADATHTTSNFMGLSGTGAADTFGSIFLFEEPLIPTDPSDAAFLDALARQL